MSRPGRIPLGGLFFGSLIFLEVVIIIFVSFVLMFLFLCFCVFFDVSSFFELFLSFLFLFKILFPSFIFCKRGKPRKTCKSALCTVDDTSCVLTIRLGPMTSVYHMKSHCRVYRNRL